MIHFPTIEEALALHDAVINQFGGSSGIRDHGLLESALYRPQTGYYNDLIEMAAALMESLALNHPFVDGNKRVAFFLTDTFLRLNGYKIKVQAKSGRDFIEGMIVESKGRFERICEWIRSQAVKV